MTDVTLARIIHERFYCNRGFAAATSLATCFTAPMRVGSLLGRSTSCLGTGSVVRDGACPSLDGDRHHAHPPGKGVSPRAPRARLARRRRDFVTNRHE
jgi:hypothetical protein